MGRNRLLDARWAFALTFVCFGGSNVALAVDSPDPAQFAPVPNIEACVVPRGGLERCRRKFTEQKTGLVAYVGGSITHNPGWSQLVDAELQRRFPETRFTFVHAGIPSVDSTGHAFRFQRDVLEKGVPDLIFLEAVVNDLHNGRTAIEQLRGMEGVVRRALRTNREVDLVLLHFAEPRYTADYEAGRTPAIIQNHERVATHYDLPSLNLAREVQLRIKAGQFEWARDFRDLHPSPFGQKLYYESIRRFFQLVWDGTATPDSRPPARRPTELPEPLDPFCYDAGQLASPNRAVQPNGFQMIPRWKPEGKAGTRAGFVDVPMWVGERPGDSFSYRFEGRGVGFFLTVGPDTATIEYRIDQGPWKSRDTFTQWSGGLHLPWALLLEAELTSGPHQLDVRIAEKGNAAARGTALRVRDILVNGPAYRLPKLEEIQVSSSLDQTAQPSLVWAPPKARQESTPLLVYLHSWSGDYRQDNSAWLHQAVEHGWIYLHPNFRGINKQPQACGSRLARQDIIDAVDHVAREYRVDPERIYLAGTSGGGHMSMLMAAYFPERFSAVSAWVGISDLADWYRFHVKDGKPDHYAQMTIDSLGGPPGHSPDIDAQYRERSPLEHLRRATQVPIDICAGVTDGKTGSVPIHHSLRAFNVVAEAGGHSPVSQAEIDQLWNDGCLAKPTADDQADDPSLGRAIFLRRQAGAARVTIFDGGHEGLAPAACDWLAKQRRSTKK